MKTSTLRKLPMPFVVACLLGISVLSFLLLRPSTEDQKSAQNGASSSQNANQVPTDSSRYRVKKSGVARLARSTSANALPAKQSQAKVQPAGNRPSQSVKPATAIASNAPKTNASNKLGTAKASKQTQTKTSSSSQQIVDRSSKTKSTKSPLARATANKAPRRDLDRVKSAKVAASTKPVPKGAYSPENPDPSELLSQALESNMKTDTPLTLNDPTDVVMPPSAGLTKGTLAAPKNKRADLAKNAGTPNQGSSTRTPTSNNTEASSVVTGELMTESNPPASKKTVRIVNPASNSVPVWFIAQQRKIQLKPGQRYETSIDEKMLVRFARGGDFGVARMAASEGDWVFSVTRQEGWKLTRN